MSFVFIEYLFWKLSKASKVKKTSQNSTYRFVFKMLFKIIEMKENDVMIQMFWFHSIRMDDKAKTATNPF